MDGHGGSLEQMNFSGDMAMNWKRFKCRFELFVEAFLPDDATEKKRVALLLHHMGEQGMEIYNSFNLKAAEAKVLARVIQEFDEYFLPQTNTTFERYVFFNRKQNEGESYEQYMAVLKNLSMSCEFDKLRDSLVVDIFISGIIHTGLKETLLKTTGLDIKHALEICKSKEITHERALQLVVKKEPDETVDFIKRTYKPQEWGSANVSHGATSRDRRCNRCGYSHNYGECRALGKKCNKCGKLNHFEKMCRSLAMNRVAHVVEKEPIGSDDFVIDTIDIGVEKGWLERDIFSVNDVGSNVSNSMWLEKLNIKNIDVIFKVDTGAQINILSIESFNKLGLNYKIIQPTNVRITSFTKNVVPIKGRCDTKCRLRGREFLLRFYIASLDCINLLGFKSCIELGLIKPDLKGEFEGCMRTVDSIQEEYKELFSGKLGQIPVVVQLELKENTSPVVCTPRRIPIALYDKLKIELQRMTDLGVIEPINEPTEWLNQIVVAEKKNGELRVCLDPVYLNNAMKRPYLQFPTLEMMTAKLTQAKYFTKLDASSGFWMLPLDDASSKMCAFQTPFGRYIFRRLPFGLNCSSEIFYKIMLQIFEGLPGVVTYVDDILIFGDSLDQLHERVKIVLERARKNGIQFNTGKCEFDKTRITFLGHEFSSEGISVDKEKIKAITELRPPRDKKALERINGLFNYLAKFIPHYSDLVRPFREMLKNDRQFSWSENMGSLFERLKSTITESPVLAYYNPNRPLVISVDASSTGLGAAAFQEGKPLAYASRALTEVQMRYAQIEKELLGILFGCERFRQFVIGNPNVVVETDHKPLISIFKKPLFKVPARLQRMLLNLHPYRIQVVYKPGRDLLIADALSRAYCPNDGTDTFDSEIELQVNLLIENMPITKAKQSLFREETNKDEILKKVIQFVTTCWPRYKKDLDEDCKIYFDMKDDLHVIDHVLFKNEAIVVPESLRQSMIEKAHVGHMGMNRCKSRLRNVLYWPRMSNDIEKYVGACDVCSSLRPNNSSAPLICHDVPELPWQDVGSDIFELKGKYYLVVVDYLSNFIEVVEISNLESNTVINKLKSIFARHGAPVKLFTDGGGSYTSNQFKDFVREWDICHVLSSPHYPRSNGMSESAVKTIKSLFTKCRAAGTDPYLGLLELRNTSRDDVSAPAQLLMSRMLRSPLPSSFKHLVPKVCLQDNRKRLILNKEKMKQYHDEKHKRKPHVLKTGQKVWFKKYPRMLGWSQGSVSEECSEPRSYQVRDEQGNQYRRNEVHINLNKDETGLNNASCGDESSGSSCASGDVSRKCSEQQVLKNFNNFTTRSGRVVKGIL